LWALGTEYGPWLAAIPSIQKVDVVELEPAILTVAENPYGGESGDALHNPKVHIMIGDAHSTSHLREKYDLIASEPSNPYRAGVAGLFTREFTSPWRSG
jgi:spermidine synthase